MKKRKCLKEHYCPYFDQICQVGRDFKFWGYCVTTSYCHFCNKVRVQRKLYFNKPNIFKNKDSEIPF